MTLLVLKAFWSLIYFDLYLVRGNFAALHNKIRDRRISARPASSADALRICSAVDYACIFYFKEVLCLQRAAATTWLLRHRGVRAEMVIGVQKLPFKAHAWVEVDGGVVNDKPYTRQIYAVLDRC
ncbi:MAG: lasso peptide biosynthesis B2 protein [Candidatus Acidiferrales bacterium]